MPWTRRRDATDQAREKRCSACCVRDLPMWAVIDRNSERGLLVWSRGGLRRREYSWASKVLHWLLPWTVPAYDAYVRRAVGVPDWDGARAYPRVANEVLALA